VEPFESTSNGGGGVALHRRIKRREATFYEVIKFDLKKMFDSPLVAKISSKDLNHEMKSKQEDENV